MKSAFEHEFTAQKYCEHSIEFNGQMRYLPVSGDMYMSLWTFNNSNVSTQDPFRFVCFLRFFKFFSLLSVFLPFARIQFSFLSHSAGLPFLHFHFAVGCDANFQSRCLFLSLFIFAYIAFTVIDCCCYLWVGEIRLVDIPSIAGLIDMLTVEITSVHYKMKRRTNNNTRRFTFSFSFSFYFALPSRKPIGRKRRRRRRRR